MTATANRLAAGLLFTLLLTGCLGVRVLSTKSVGVDRIPTKLAFYPLLSTPVGSRVASRVVIEQAIGASRDKLGENVVITPPADTEMQITQESQIMTGLISTLLSAWGFSLKELPVEVRPDDQGSDNHNKESNRFIVSMNLLDQLREKYDFRGLIVGSAFFTVDRVSGVAERRVTAIHLKVIDIETLDVLAQATIPYEAAGADMNEVADKMAMALAEMAGLALE